MANEKGTTAAKGKGKGKGKKEVAAPAKGKASAPAKGKKETAAPAPAAKGKAAKGKAAPAKTTKGNPNIGKIQGRGRKAGVRNEVEKKHSEQIMEEFQEITSVYEALSENIDSFLEKANKKAAAEARKNLQNLVCGCKTMRKTVQDAKLNLKQVSI